MYKDSVELSQEIDFGNKGQIWAHFKLQHGNKAESKERVTTDT